MNLPSSNKRQPPLAPPLHQLLAHTSAAVQAVLGGRSLNEALANTPAPMRAATQSLSFLCMRRLGAAQFARSQLVPKAPAAPIDALLQVCLALLWPQGRPPYDAHTLVNQAVLCAQKHLGPRGKAAAGLVNAVLRRFLREQAAIEASAQQDPVARWNHPRWWVERLAHDWPSQHEALLSAAHTHAPMALRVNARQSTVKDYLQTLAEAGLSAQAMGEACPQGIVLERPCPVTALPGFEQGMVSVQDASAQRAAPLLLNLGQGADPHWHLPPGARVLDACAAPGGKTAHLLELADLDVTALDQDPERLLRVQDTLSRTKLSARLLSADASKTDEWWDGQPFDAILLDAPCSASGIVRRHPDVPWLRRATDIDALARIQGQLLTALWPLLRPSGRLLYATCSTFKAEGQDQIDAFLQQHPDARRVSRPASPGHLLALPDNPPDQGDGFFYALLQKEPD